MYKHHNFTFSNRQRWREIVFCVLTSAGNYIEQIKQYRMDTTEIEVLKTPKPISELKRKDSCLKGLKN